MSATDNIKFGIDQSTAYQRAQAEKEAAKDGGVSHNEFIKLLTTQLSHQDPLNPMQDIDFTSQLAQLNALEEQIAMTKTMKAMRVDSQLQAGTGMIGKFVSGVDVNKATATGMVVRVTQDSDGVYVELANKQKVDVSNIANVWNDATGMYNDIASSGNVIGMWVEAGLDENAQPIRGIVEKIQVENGQVLLKLYGGQTVSWNQVTELRVPTDDELWYTLPDAIRTKVESARKMVNKGVTGTDDNGNEVKGIVGGAELDGSKVYLILYSGERINFDNIKDTRKPTGEDAASSLNRYWVVGLDVDSTDLSGIVVGGGDDEAGTYVLLDSGKKLFFDTIKEIREPAGDELARLIGLKATGIDTTGAEVTGIIVKRLEIDSKLAVELDNGRTMLCEKIASLAKPDA